MHQLRSGSLQRLHDGRTMHSCVAGFGLINGACLPCNVNDCGVCNNNVDVCTSCLINYTFSQSGQCFYCGIPNCLLCSSLGVCANCSGVTNFYNAGSACLYCDTDCLVCSSNKVCQTCVNSGYKPN
jgi:hypothetical protein